MSSPPSRLIRFLILHRTEFVGNVVDHVGHFFAREFDTLLAERLVDAVGDAIAFAHDATTRFFTLLGSQQEAAGGTESGTSDESGKEIQTFHNIDFIK